MSGEETEDRKKIDRPTPFVVYLTSFFIGFIMFMVGIPGLIYLLKIHEYFDGQGLEFNIFVGLIVGLVLTIAFGGVFGYLANKQIIDMKE